MPVISNCIKCGFTYDFDEHFPMNCPCGGYSICRKCTIKFTRERGCVTCDKDVHRYFRKNPVFADQAEKRKQAEDQNIKMQLVIAEKERKIQTISAEISLLDKSQRKRKLIEVACVNCEAVETEDCFNICTTCMNEQIRANVSTVETTAVNSEGVADTSLTSTPAKKAKKDISSFAICSTCSIRKHIRSGHEVVDYYPVLASKNHKKQKVISDDKCSKFDDVWQGFQEITQQWATLVKRGKDEVQKMTDMVRRGRSSMTQKEIGMKIDNQSDIYMKRIKSVMENMMTVGNNIYADLEKSNEDNLKVDAEKCFPDVSEADTTLSVKVKTELNQ